MFFCLGIFTLASFQFLFEADFEHVYHQREGNSDSLSRSQRISSCRFLSVPGLFWLLFFFFFSVSFCCCFVCLFVLFFYLFNLASSSLSCFGNSEYTDRNKSAQHKHRHTHTHTHTHTHAHTFMFYSLFS